MGVSGVGTPGLAVWLNMCARPDAGRVLGWCVIVAVILGHNDVTGIAVTTIISCLKSGTEIAKEIYRLWNELGKSASKWI